MKLIRSQKPSSTGSAFVFRISQREKDTLLATLQLYPMLDASYHQLSRKPKTTGRADQEWLEEAMDQQRQDHKKKLGQFFNNDRRFFKDSQGELRFTLTGEQMEWLLRVLNEIRVGSWVQLGRPELDVARKMNLTSAQVRLFTAMELSGYFEANLLEAFS
jgi:hypothetical protein